jgi:hypothetical protein
MRAMHKRVSIGWCLAALLVPSMASAVQFEQGKLLAADGAEQDFFGSSVAVSEFTTVVGAQFDDDLRGSAYVFIGAPSAQAQTAKLLASDRAPQDLFGVSVAVFGDTILVGAPADDTFAGSAYVFTLVAGTWTQQAKLVANDAAILDRFGISVALGQDLALIGSPGDDDGADASGSAYVFTRMGTTWTQSHKLHASDAAKDDGFGTAVALHQNRALVGASGDNAKAGSAYVFTRAGGTFTQQAKLVASDAAANDTFGIAVSISGDTALIGARLDDDLGTNSGSAYIFRYNAGAWTQQQKLTASDGSAGDEFGVSVSVNNGNAVVGSWLQDHVSAASGAAYLFARNPQTGVWSQYSKLAASDASGGDNFGISVSVGNDLAAVGSFADDQLGNDSGSAYLFAPLPVPVLGWSALWVAAGVVQLGFWKLRRRQTAN